MTRAVHLPPGAPKRWRRAGAVLLCLMLAGPAHGATVSGLYTAEVAVVDQSDEARRDALRAGLEQVLVRVSGDSAASLAAQVEDPGRYLQRYSYTEGRGDDLILEARFDEADVDRLLRDHGHTPWGPQRPETLAWIAVQSTEERHILARDSTGPIAQALSRAARRRGLPITLPLMDVEDQSRVVFGDIRGGFYDRLGQAAERYDPDRVLVANVEQLGGNAWEGQWTLLTDDGRERWRSSVGEADMVVRAGLAELGERYLARFGTAPGQGEHARAVLVSVQGVSELDAYARVLSYLDSVSAVEAVSLRDVGPDRLGLRLNLSGTVERFDEVVKLGRVLDRAAPDPDAARPENPDGPPRLYYAWTGRAG